jgi:hypothetical protein
MLWPEVKINFVAKHSEQNVVCLKATVFLSVASRLCCCLDSKNFGVDSCLFSILLIALGCKLIFFSGQSVLENVTAKPYFLN